MSISKLSDAELSHWIAEKLEALAMNLLRNELLDDVNQARTLIRSVMRRCTKRVASSDEIMFLSIVEDLGLREGIWWAETFRLNYGYPLWLLLSENAVSEASSGSVPSRDC